MPGELEPLAQSVLTEAMRNVVKHADPTRVDVAVGRDDDTFTLEIRNDGVRPGARGAGMGLRLARSRRSSTGAWSSSDRVPDDGWRVRLVVPLAERP